MKRWRGKEERSLGLHLEVSLQTLVDGGETDKGWRDRESEEREGGVAER